jgi:hypothetical protein
MRIRAQFGDGGWQEDSQVLWTGIPRDYAQKWADERGKQTLTTVMGPLMQKNIQEESSILVMIANTYDYGHQIRKPSIAGL